MALPGATFAGLLQAAPEAILLADVDGHIVEANQRIEAMFGYSHAELVSQPVEILMPERFRRAHMQHRADYLTASPSNPQVPALTGRLDIWGLRKDGGEFPIEISLSPLAGKNPCDNVQEAEQEGEAEITMADTGPGIPPEVLPHIFQPFVSRRAEGTGLGLAVTNEIIQQHGGRIKVQSETGKGTRFVFRLPISVPLSPAEMRENEV